MRTHPTLDTRQALRLAGMYHALVEQMQTPEIATLSFEERLGLLVDHVAGFTRTGRQESCGLGGRLHMD